MEYTHPVVHFASHLQFATNCTLLEQPYIMAQALKQIMSNRMGLSFVAQLDHPDNVGKERLDKDFHTAVIQNDQHCMLVLFSPERARQFITHASAQDSPHCDGLYFLKQLVDCDKTINIQHLRKNWLTLALTSSPWKLKFSTREFFKQIHEHLEMLKVHQNIFDAVQKDQKDRHKNKI